MTLCGLLTSKPPGLRDSLAMSNHVENLVSLSHVWQVPQAGAVEEERQPAAQKVRRAGSTCARWTVAEEQRLTEAVTELGERA